MPAKTPKPVTAEDLRREAMEQELLHKIAKMAEMLKGVESCTVDVVSLEASNIAIGQPLDVDDGGSWDSATTFFSPWVSEEFIRDLEDSEGCRYSWTDKYLSEFTPAEFTISKKSRWFVYCLEYLCEIDPGIWDPWNERDVIFEGTGLYLPMHWFYNYNGPSIEREYQSQWAYFPVDKTKPHLACMVFDSNDTARNKVLRSEVDHAIHLLAYRLQRGRHTNHHTKPVLIYTIERDSFARITQAHFDAKTNKLVSRQSRQLDLRGPEPTADAFLLLRWMANRPVGETEYADEVESEEDEVPTRGESDTAPKLLVGCA